MNVYQGYTLQEGERELEQFEIVKNGDKFCSRMGPRPNMCSSNIGRKYKLNSDRGLFIFTTRHKETLIHPKTGQPLPLNWGL